ncbi:hypothetical protein [Stutzerimonas stutzeri]|uniref:hypothetical protein n=1 Tax=Stutzerimonas stutzeri TaxID=316 RepID=UPI000C9B9438|nr:hypothetical protein [Stutzerimonas stutzeri]PNG11870.1 hypothetical protein CXK97_19285 [Stutzerimonas stutzeri]
MAELQRSSENCPKCGADYSGSVVAKRTSSSRLKLVFAVFALVVLGYASVQYYEYRQAVGALEQKVRLASAYTEQVVTSLEDSGSMTFAELFAKVSRNIEEVDSLLVQASVIDGADAVKDQSMIYMKRAQDVMRGVSVSVRQMMEYSSAADRLKAAELRISSAEPGFQYSQARESRLKAVDDQIAALEAHQKTRKALSDSSDKMREAAEQMQRIDPDALMKPPLYDKLKFTK